MTKERWTDPHPQPDLPWFAESDDDHRPAPDGRPRYPAMMRPRCPGCRQYLQRGELTLNHYPGHGNGVVWWHATCATEARATGSPITYGRGGRLLPDAQGDGGHQRGDGSP